MFNYINKINTYFITILNLIQDMKRLPFLDVWYLCKRRIQAVDVICAVTLVAH